MYIELPLIIWIMPSEILHGGERNKKTIWWFMVWKWKIKQNKTKKNLNLHLEFLQELAILQRVWNREDDEISCKTSRGNRGKRREKEKGKDEAKKRSSERHVGAEGRGWFTVQKEERVEVVLATWSARGVKIRLSGKNTGDVCVLSLGTADGLTLLRLQRTQDWMCICAPKQWDWTTLSRHSLWDTDT